MFFMRIPQCGLSADAYGENGYTIVLSAVINITVHHLIQNGIDAPNWEGNMEHLCHDHEIFKSD